MKDIVHKIVLITGGGSGIGRLLAVELAERGGRVVAWDLNQEALKDLENEGRQRNLFIKGMVCDVTDREAVYAAAEVLNAELGPPDVLVNNAGIVSGSPFLETPDEKLVKTMEVNVLSHFWTCKAFLPSMIARNTGHLVTVSSAAGLIGVRSLADYSASKFASFGFHESLRMELRSQKSAVKTTVVCPFFIDTGLFRGAKTRFPLVLPILKSTYVARRIARAILTDKERLILPWFVFGVLPLRLLPPRGFDFIADFWGVNHSMDNFIGREKKNG
ncbi:MAG: SDR family oxidoreductase [Spirochaetaceae bacterium]|jgi:all-trans-retinol dehydrogenase (NAD+)|nr:SDR family oxidoreductase [Spirochaetaceae bacterium]